MTDSKMRRVEANLPVSLTDLDGPLWDAVEWVNKLIECVPVEYRHAAQIDVDTGCDWTILSVYYNRPETDQDRENDLATARVYRQREEAAERAQLQRLKIKYEK